MSEKVESGLPTDAQLDEMRRNGLSIDGDNAYKRDLLDCIVGTLAFGKQGTHKPPEGHWAELFWGMARAEGELQEELLKGRDSLNAEIQRQRERHRTTWTQLEQAQRDNDQLRSCLADARYRIEQGRVWSGMGWTLTGLSANGQQKALDAIDAAPKAALSQQAEPNESELEALGLGYPFSKEDAVKLWYKGFRTEPIALLEVWEAIGHDVGIDPSKHELMDSLRNMEAICRSHGYDFPSPAEPAPAQDERAIDTAPLLNFIFSEYGSPEMASNLPDDVVRVVRALEAATRPAQTEQQPGLRHTGQWESARVADYNAGWNDRHTAEFSRLTDDQIFDIAEPFGEFRYGDANGDKRLAFARAIIAATAAAPIAQTAPQPEQSEPNHRTLQWVVDRWHAEVANRPLVNVHRRTLDSTWRQMIRHLGEDDVVLLGPRHDDMLDASGNPLPQYVATQQENSHE